MKKALISAAAVILCAYALVFFPVRGEHTLYDGVIRLHVIAASDGEEDQKLKLAVRDSVLSALKEKLDGVTNKETAERVIGDSLDEVREAAERTVADRGADCLVAATFSAERYPERDYGSFALPGGEYASLRVTLGDGAGKNWWCMIFPSFCTSSALESEERFEEAGISGDRYELIKTDAAPRYRVRFRILEIFSGLFGFEY